MAIPVLLFVLGLILLIKGGDWFVDGATGIAARLHVPEVLIGATIVSIGTTLPEVMVSVNSALKGHGEIAYGNAIGSIICNTALIAALTITIKPIAVDRKSLKVPVAAFFIAAAAYAAVAYTGIGYTRLVGIALLVIFAVYMLISVRSALRDAGREIERAAEIAAEEKNSLPVDSDEMQYETDDSPQTLKEKFKKFRASLCMYILLLIVGAVLIAEGADLLVDNGMIIAKALKVPESVIGLTFVALGTSLPEFVTAITSLIKGHGALSLGNIIGANLFNLVLVSGAAIALRPFDIPMNSEIFGVNASLVLDIPLMILVMAIMTLPALIRGKLARTQGIVLLVLYASFCAYQFIFV